MKEFEELVDAHYQALYRFGYSMCKSSEIASDLVQQTFCIWAEKGHQLKDRSKAKSWLFTTLYREYLGYARKRKRFVDKDASDMEYALPTVDADEGRQMDANRAVGLLSGLDPIFRAPLTLFYLQQNSYKEIAEILEIPIGTVMSRISRGKALLKKQFETAKEAQSGEKVIPINRKESANG